MIFFRYVAIQLLAYVVDMGMFLIVFKFGLFGPIVSNVIAKLAAGLFAFVAHRNFTFQAGGRDDRTHQALRYSTLFALNIPCVSGIQAVLLMWLGEPVATKFIADIVSVPLTFWLSKSFVFISKQKNIANKVEEGHK